MAVTEATRLRVHTGGGERPAVERLIAFTDRHEAGVSITRTYSGGWSCTLAWQGAEDYLVVGIGETFDRAVADALREADA